MYTNKILVDSLRLNFLIESRQDSLGKTCYVVCFSDKKIRFRSFDSVMDFINMNSDLGYVK